MDDDLKEIAMWLKFNRLSLNIKKFMIFSGRNKPSPNLATRIYGEFVNDVEKTYFSNQQFSNETLLCMIYCNHVWDSTCATYLNSSVILQKRVFRIIVGIKP